jgi:hypothetical protein
MEENLGNNLECIKALRVNVQLYEDVTLNNRPNFRYYFPETPELNGKNIVNIKFNAGASISGQIEALGQTVIDLPNSIISENTQGINQQPAGPQFGVGGVDLDKYLLLTIYNEKKEQVLSSYPCHDLAGYYRNSGGSLVTDSLGKIRPFDFKIDIRSSFVTSTSDISILTQLPPIACFTFYYK